MPNDGKERERDVQVDVERLASGEVRLTVTVESERVDGALRRAHRSLQRGVRIPGFRPGRLPRPLLEMRVGRQAFQEEALRALVEQVREEALRQAGVAPLGEVSVEPVELRDGEPATLQLRYIGRPEVTLPDYRSLRIPRPEVTLEEADVERALRALQEAHARYVPAEVAAADSLLVADVELTDESGEHRVEQDVQIALADESLPASLRESLSGARAGDVRQVQLPWVWDEGAEPRSTDVRIAVKEVRARELPEVDDDFAREVGAYSSLQELRDHLANETLARKRQVAEAAWRQELVDRVVADSQLTVPEALITAYLDRGYKSDEGRPAEAGADADASREARRSEIERQLKTELVLNAIGERESVGVSQEEWWQWANILLGERFRKGRVTREELEAVRRTAYRTKVIDLLAQYAEGRSRPQDEGGTVSSQTAS